MLSSHHISLLQTQPKSVISFSKLSQSGLVSTLHLTNSSKKIVIYKIKPTARQSYRIKPKFGSIEPGQDIKLRITLCPSSYKSSAEDKHQFMLDKFMLHVMPCHKVIDSFVQVDYSSFQKLWADLLGVMKGQKETKEFAVKVDLDLVMQAQASSVYVQTQPESVIMLNSVIEKKLTANVKAKNISNYTVLFKMRTNAPKSYIARPSYGAIKPNQTVDLRVIYESFNYKSQGPMGTDKFLLDVKPIEGECDEAKLENSGYFKGVWDSLGTKAQPQAVKFVVKMDLEAISDADSSDDMETQIEENDLDKVNGYIMLNTSRED